MKIWLSKNSEVPVREQIVTQITLGIVSGDLPFGKRLPSTKEISNRFGVHPNTVSGAYQKLAEQGWIEFKKGSGFYVREVKEDSFDSGLKLEKLIAEFFQSAAKLGFSTEEVKNRLQKYFEIQTSERIIVVESDRGLREILAEEIKNAVNLEVEAIGFDEFASGFSQTEAVIAAMFDEKSKLEKIISPERIKVYLKLRSIPGSMTGEKRPDATDLIAVVSGWEKFLVWSKTILLAAQIEPESLILRSTAAPNWKNGLKSCAMIICDSLTAKKLGKDFEPRVFRIISDESLDELVKLSQSNPS